MGDKLREACAQGEVEVLAESNARRYEGEIDAVCGYVKGKSEKEIWLIAHLFEPFFADNSVSVVMAIEIAKQIKKLGVPNFSLRLVFSAETYGLAAVWDHYKDTLRGKVLGAEMQWSETFTVPVTQEIRLENGGVQLPAAIAGELSNMTLTLMNMGKGELCNVLVKLEAEGVMDEQSVLVGTMAAGETAQPRLTFTPKLNSVGAHAAVVTVSCEDAYGNAFSQTLDAVLTVEEPIPEAELENTEETEAPNPRVIALCIVNALLILALILLGTILTKKIHTLEEERL